MVISGDNKEVKRYIWVGKNCKKKNISGQKYVTTPQRFISELLLISQSRKPDQLVSLGADHSETNTAVSGSPGCPFIAAQPPFDQSPITIRCIDQSGLSLRLCLSSVRAVGCEAERR